MIFNGPDKFKPTINKERIFEVTTTFDQMQERNAIGTWGRYDGIRYFNDDSTTDPITLSAKAYVDNLYIDGDGLRACGLRPSIIDCPVQLNQFIVVFDIIKILMLPEDTVSDIYCRQTSMYSQDGYPFISIDMKAERSLKGYSSNFYYHYKFIFTDDEYKKITKYLRDENNKERLRSILVEYIEQYVYLDFNVDFYNNDVIREIRNLILLQI